MEGKRLYYITERMHKQTVYSAPVEELIMEIGSTSGRGISIDIIHEAVDARRNVLSLTCRGDIKTWDLQDIFIYSIDNLGVEFSRNHTEKTRNISHLSPSVADLYELIYHAGGIYGVDFITTASFAESVSDINTFRD